MSKVTIQYYLNKRRKPGRVVEVPNPIYLKGEELFPLNMLVIAHRNSTRLASKFYEFQTSPYQDIEELQSNFITNRAFDELLNNKRSYLYELRQREEETIQSLVGLVFKENKHRFSFANFSQAYKKACSPLQTIFFGSASNSVIRESLATALREQYGEVGARIDHVLGKVVDWSDSKPEDIFRFVEIQKRYLSKEAVSVLDQNFSALEATLIHFREFIASLNQHLPLKLIQWPVHEVSFINYCMERQVPEFIIETYRLEMEKQLKTLETLMMD